MNAIDKIKEQIARGATVIGTHVSLADINISEMLGDIGFDFIWFDWEHSAMDRQHIKNHLIAARASGTAGFVRVPWNDPVLVKPILEQKPDGVIFPMIRTAEEARLAVRACVYPPKGERGFGPMRANRYGTMPIDTYMETVEASFWRIMQIEHIDGVQNLEEILRVPGVGSIVVGPNDLSGSVGLLTQTRHPEVLALMDEIAEKCNRAGIPFGVSMGYDPISIEDWKRRGVAWIGVGGDSGYIAEAGQDTRRKVRKIFGMEEERTNEDCGVGCV